MIKPTNLSANVTKYRNNEENLILSEKETLFPLETTNEEEIVQNDSAHLTGVLIKFDLPSSSYATILLREFMHSSSLNE